MGKMATTQVTDEAMMAASMSLFISDQGMLNAGISSVVYSNAVGATEGSLNLVNADTLTDEKLRAEIKEQEEKNQDALEAASDMVNAAMEEQLERLKKSPIDVGGFTLTLEEWEGIEESLSTEEGRNFVTQRLLAQNYTEAEAAQAILALEAMSRIAQAKAHGLEPAAGDLAIVEEANSNPKTKAAMSDALDHAKEHYEARTELTVQEARLEDTFQNTQSYEVADSISSMINNETNVINVAEISEGVSFGGSSDDFFGGMEPASSSFNMAALGSTETNSTPEAGVSQPASELNISI